MFSDVTCVVATPTAFGQLVQCPYSSAMNMLARLRRLLGRENGEGRESREGQTQAGLQPPCKRSRRKWSRRWYRTSKEPPPTPTHLTKRQVKQKVESLTTQLREMTAQRNDLRDRLILVTEGSLDKRPYHRPNPFYEKLKMQHQQVMSDLQNFENENMEAAQKLRELTKEKVFLCDLESRLLMEQSQQMKKLDMLRLEKEKLLEEWALLKHHLGELKVPSKDQEETSDLQNEEQQEQQRMEERLQSLLKQRELVSQQLHLAIKLQHHLTVSQMRSEKLHDLEQSTAQDESLLPTELLQQEH
ncbi:disks large homolog 5-like isoform X1 [Peromyscus maniculatus bairdii]|uniref:disks large homolog 5-like isoform X1 n=1 Tax=Peromyscus maniculatus bairdii TaxID=230844 RepID=UPI003FD26D70